MELFLVYCWLKLDALQIFFTVFAFCGWLIFGGLHLCAGESYERKLEEKCRRIAKWVGWFAVFSLPMAILLPSSKDVAILVGTSYGLDLARSPVGAKVQSLLLQKANKLLDEELAKGAK